MEGHRAAFARFFGSFDNLPGLTPSKIPAFQEGYALTVENAAPPFPYITYPPIVQPFDRQTVVTASVWNRMPGNPGHFGLADHVAGQFRNRFSKGSVVLELGNGCGGILLRFAAAFPIPDADRLVTRMALQMVVKDFTI